MFTLFLRAVFLYMVLIITMRALGKRQMGELQPYEFALTLLLAEVIADPVNSVSMPLVHGLLPAAAVVVVHGIISIACLKSDKFRSLVSGKPILVVNRGVIDRKALDKLCLSLADLLEGLRGAGYLDPAEVGTAIVEANGTISAFADADSRPPKTMEMNLSPGYEGMPLLLVMDGKIQKCNLQQSGKDEKWLNALLSERGQSYKNVYLASVDTGGNMLLQLMDGSVQCFSAMKTEEVIW